MSRGREQDTESDYKPNTAISKPRKSSRARRQIEQVDYSEAEIISDTESETTNSSEGTFMVDGPERGERQVKGETDWELSKVKRNVFKQLGEYSGRRTYHQKDFHKQQDSTGQGYKRIACFQSGKLGHVSWECSRARLAGENPKPPPLVANIHTSM